MQQAGAVRQAALHGVAGCNKTGPPRGWGCCGAGWFRGIPPYPLPYLPGGVAEKVGAGFQQGVYKITPILQTSLSNIAIYDNYTGGYPENQGAPRRNGSPG